MTVCSVDGRCNQLTFDIMECDIEPIVVPADWNGEKDLQDLEDIFGMELEESKLSPYDFILCMLSDAQEHSSMVVENAVSFLLGQLPARMIQRVPANLTGPRLVLLRKLVACVPPDKDHDGYVAAIESSAEAIRYYQSQLDDLLPPLVVNEAPPWLFILRSLRDSISLAADSLDNDMHFTYSKYPYMAGQFDGGCGSHDQPS
jgi:hypothetical protein